MKTELVYFNNIQREIIFYIGKNDIDNFTIIDMASPNDMWFHANDYSSCHVVAKMDNTDDLSKKELHSIYKKGALLCKENTNKLKKLSNIEFIYTYIKNITKTDKTGCVLTKDTKKIVC